MSTPSEPTGTQAGLPACVRHPGRQTGLRCTRCDRPACPECLVEASVGFQCVDCVRQGRSEVRRATTVAGAELSDKPVLVPALIAVNVAMFVITVALARDLFNNQQSELFAALLAYAPSIAEGEWWRTLTSGFLHYGPLHVLVNCVALWFLRDIELLLGRLRFALVYFLSMLGGSATVYLFDAVETRSTGASGAVYGMLGGLLVAVIRLKRDKHVLMSVLGIIALNIAFSISVPGISLLAHLGGLVVGAVVTAGMVYAPTARRLPVQIGTVVAVVVVLVALFVVRTPQVKDQTFCVNPTTLECYYATRL
ncbi:Membrane associated serine protease, rhomboid family [Actinokineospora alba]|uniref:Membrane associated serine protease, rhomboid family n=1 Tax=Actinokineospora alba TaxID=504798 RepID=A0A1H0WBK9_9PSEU|nr:rhomboid family intramembrane serine protease [Actinokineospora alba]TDP66145.1 membrane associated rhomboid family serine protease [Actinokineospora alba]SDJ41431.1 Membrane associated serine protease, rhomboid family [Actinokineospora alba]SDP87998.1 Membrane associated serine protease, rhomboid family [Actinokineospora alba]